MENRVWKKYWQKESQKTLHLELLEAADYCGLTRSNQLPQGAPNARASTVNNAEEEVNNVLKQ